MNISDKFLCRETTTSEEHVVIVLLTGTLCGPNARFLCQYFQSSKAAVVYPQIPICAIDASYNRGLHARVPFDVGNVRYDYAV